ncbi:arylsulfatase [Virgibacillus halophilus]|uniref:Arylsulfatase n=1 Tax=Tigheibacillus halophilus TaxID=361280 RepID=A0ABU5C4B5_9BACI|nr:arylsulfatase [Virgibacillus halophilus]
MRTKQPNIIYILADDMGYGDLSCLNEASKINTVNLDGVAKEGMAFTDAHASSAVCTPSRYSILTGRYNWRSSLKRGVLGGYSEPLIEDGRLTVASMLKTKDYRTACVGKWHLGLDWRAKSQDPTDVDYSKPIADGPLQHGFDYFYGISASLDMPPYVYIENDQVTQIPASTSKSREGKGWWREGPIAPDFKHEEVLPRLNDKVLDTIELWKDDPFFLYYALPAPHTPILPLEQYRGKTGLNEYGDFVYMCDDLIGDIMNKLIELGLYENTILVFTSDNGCSPEADFGELSYLGHHPSYHFRGHKADIYEGGHRVPLLIRWPEYIKPNMLTEEPVCLVDLMATLADIVDFQLPDDAGEDSISNLPLWSGQKLDRSLREATVHHSIDGSFSIRQGKWKLELCPGSGGWSYPKPGEESSFMPPFQLYDLHSDIGEKVNVALDYPDKVEHLRELLREYVLNGRSTPGKKQKNTGAPYWEELHWMQE